MPNYYDNLTAPIDYVNRITWDTITTNTVETPQININPNGITYEYKPYEFVTKFVTEEMLNEFARKIFRIIEEHTPIDITEEEFMDIIEEGK